MKGGGRAHLAVGHRADKAAARYPAFTLALALAGCPVVVAGPGDWRPSFRPALPDAFTPMSPSAYHRAVPPSTAPAEDTLTPVEHVNIYTGTQPELNGISFGNVLPLVTVPWAFQSWFPQTRPSPASRWPFEASDERPGLAPGPQFYGMRATHQASPWVGDWGAFQLITTVGDDDAPSGHSPPLGKRRLNAWLNATAKKQASQRDVQNSHALLRARAMQRASQGWGVRPPWGTTPAQPTQTRFSHLDWRKSVAQPHLFTADLRDSESGANYSIRFAPTSHAAVLEVQYDSAEARALPKRLTVNFHACSFIPPVNITARQTSPTEFAVVSRGGVCPEANCAVKFELHLALALSVAPISWRVSSLGPSVFKSTLELELSPGTRQLTARVGTSFISADLARLSLQRQVGGRGLEEVGKQGAARWNEVLSSATLDIVGNGKSKERVAVERATFYTNAYRASHFPRFIDEVSTDGSFVHWSPYTGRKPLAGRLVADSGFWDAYRTVYPWLSLTQPEVLGEMLQGWLNAASEWGGWLAQWASPGDAFSMGGSTLSDVVFSDAIAKGISGFDRSQAFRLLLRNAMDNSGGSGAQGRSAWPRQGRSKRLASESSPGYLPGKEEWGVSYNLETCYCNFAIARAAERLCADDVDTEATCLGRSGASLLAELDARAANYSSEYDLFPSRPSSSLVYNDVTPRNEPAVPAGTSNCVHSAEGPSLTKVVMSVPVVGSLGRRCARRPYIYRDINAAASWARFPTRRWGPEGCRRLAVSPSLEGGDLKSRSWCRCAGAMCQRGSRGCPGRSAARRAASWRSCRAVARAARAPLRARSARPRKTSPSAAGRWLFPSESARRSGTGARCRRRARRTIGHTLRD